MSPAVGALGAALTLLLEAAVVRFPKGDPVLSWDGTIIPADSNALG